jgi:hypothetical protein
MTIPVLVLPKVFFSGSLRQVFCDVSGGIPDGERYSGNVNNVGPPVGGLLPGGCNDVLGDIAIPEDMEVLSPFFCEFFDPEVTDVAIAFISQEPSETVKGVHYLPGVIGVLGEGEEADHALGSGLCVIFNYPGSAVPDLVTDFVHFHPAAVGAVIAPAGGRNDCRLIFDGAPEETDRMRAFYKLGRFHQPFK